MTAQDYPVEFGFHAQDGQYYGPSGSVGLYHLGADRYCPTGTPVVIAGTEIGLTGATGMVAGPHLHIQAWQGAVPRNAIDPAPYEFKPGTVTAVATSSDFGKYIIIDVNGTNVAYCHLSVQQVTVGQVIGEDMGLTAEQVNKLSVLASFQESKANPGVLGNIGLDLDTALNNFLSYPTTLEYREKAKAGGAGAQQLKPGIYEVKL